MSDESKIEIKLNRTEALQHFKEEYFSPAGVKLMDDTIEYIKTNREDLTITFVEKFRELCKKIKQMQEEGKKGKIAYITYSFGKENYKKESREYVVQAYESEWFEEESEECKISYDVDWLYTLLDNMFNPMVEISKQYDGKITSADLDGMWEGEIRGCDAELVKFARMAIREAVEIDEFKAVDKKQVVEIRLGEYKGYNEIILKIDTRIKASNEIKNWLEATDKSYSYEIFRNLDLSGGDYQKITAHYSEIIGCDLSNTSFERADMLGTIIEKSIIKGANFNKAKLSNGKLLDMV